MALDLRRHLAHFESPYYADVLNTYETSNDKMRCKTR